MIDDSWWKVEDPARDPDVKVMPLFNTPSRWWSSPTTLPTWCNFRSAVLPVVPWPPATGTCSYHKQPEMRMPVLRTSTTTNHLLLPRTSTGTWYVVLTYNTTVPGTAPGTGTWVPTCVWYYRSKPNLSDPPNGVLSCGCDDVLGALSSDLSCVMCHVVMCHVSCEDFDPATTIHALIIELTNCHEHSSLHHVLFYVKKSFSSVSSSTTMNPALQWWLDDLRQSHAASDFEKLVFSNMPHGTECNLVKTTKYTVHQAQAKKINQLKADVLGKCQRDPCCQVARRKKKLTGQTQNNASFDFDFVPAFQAGGGNCQSNDGREFPWNRGGQNWSHHQFHGERRIWAHDDNGQNIFFGWKYAPLLRWRDARSFNFSGLVSFWTRVKMKGS